MAREVKASQGENRPEPSSKGGRGELTRNPKEVRTMADASQMYITNLFGFSLKFRQVDFACLCGVSPMVFALQG